MKVIIFGATGVTGNLVLSKRLAQGWECIASLSLTYALSNFAVTEKWKKRVETAQSEQQMQKATADGANKVFTLLFFAPLEAVLFTWFWFWLGRKVWRPQNDRLD